MLKLVTNHTGIYYLGSIADSIRQFRPLRQTLPHVVCLYVCCMLSVVCHTRAPC